MVHNVWIINAPGPYDIGKANMVDNVGRKLTDNDLIYLDPNVKVFNVKVRL